jgi:serine/threonine protein kinase
MNRDHSAQRRRLDATTDLTGNFDDHRVIEAVQEFLAALEAGESPSREEFLQRHPEIARELSVCLDGLQLVHGITPTGRRSEANGEAEATSPLPLGDFRLIREIGRGGMGVVYEAMQLSLNRRVAVKVLPLVAALDPTHLQRFKNEAQAAAQLHHTNIVPVYAVGVDRGVHFYAMQLIEGEPLSLLISHLRQRADKRRKPNDPTALTVGHPADRHQTAPHSDAADFFLSSTASGPVAVTTPSSTSLIAKDATHYDYFRRAAELIRQAATALEHAHQFGVIHRDIKPANLLVDARGNLWVTDFGLAQVHADVTLTRTGDVVGTLRYMSPEQAAGDRVILDHRTDIYSLGVTLYELLALEPVFGESDRFELMRCILEEEPRSLRSFDKNIPLELETIVLKATAKTASDRYATAQHFADDLQRWLDDKPILAKRPTLLEHAYKWCRRHRSVVQASAVFLCLAVVGLLVSTIMIAREHSATKIAYDREIAQRAAADESFRQARQAVDAFTRLAEEELADTPTMQPLRRRFLETSLEYYDNFLKQRQDDPAVTAELAATSERVARILDELAMVEKFAPLMLLSDSRVQEDLGISSTQQSQVEELLSQLMADRKLARASERQLSQEMRQQQLASILRSYEEKIAGVVGRQPLPRLKQILWQQQGPFAFKNAEIVAALELTADQRKQVIQIIEEEAPHRRDHGGPRPGEGPPPDDDFGGPHHDGFDGPPPPGRKTGKSREGAGKFGEPPPPRPKQDSFARFDEDFGDGPPPRPKSGESYRRDDGPDHGPHGRPGAGPPPRNGGPGGMRETMDRTTKRIVEILTPVQRAKWQAIIGEPFAHDLHRGPDQWMPR